MERCRNEKARQIGRSALFFVALPQHLGAHGKQRRHAGMHDGRAQAAHHPHPDIRLGKHICIIDVFGGAEARAHGKTHDDRIDHEADAVAAEKPDHDGAFEGFFQERRHEAAVVRKRKLQQVERGRTCRITRRGRRHSQQHGSQHRADAHELETVQPFERHDEQRHGAEPQARFENELRRQHCLDSGKLGHRISLRCARPSSNPTASPSDRVMGRRTAIVKFQSSWNPTSSSCL
jgi:hypothetical protein